MSELEHILKILTLNPNSAFIFTSSIVVGFFYIFKIRLTLIERKLGITQNGKPLEQVITRADLNEFGDKLIRELSDKFITKDICALQHEVSSEAIIKLEEAIRLRRR